MNYKTLNNDSRLHAINKPSKMKKTVLILYTYYLPGIKAGGPVQSISGLVNGLKDEYIFKIICSDRDAGDRQPYTNEPFGQWYKYGEAQVLRIPPGYGGVLTMINAIRHESYDIIYINGVWPRVFSMLPMACRRLGILPSKPMILAPRGEFSHGSLSIKNKRKMLYIKISSLLGYYKNMLWHASTHLEEMDIRRIMGNHVDAGIASSFINNVRQNRRNGSGTIVVAKDIHLIAEFRGRARTYKYEGQLRIAFVSRISPEKNLLYALRVLHGLTGNVSFNIYGPMGDEVYWNKCEEVIGRLPCNIQVKYMGVIEHERVAEVFAENHLLLLPTLGENYSHVICEALCAGCPVLISDRTPWQNLEEKGIGWDIPLEKEEQFSKILQLCVDYNEESYKVLVARASEYGKMAVSDPAVIDENRRMLEYAESFSLK